MCNERRELLKQPPPSGSQAEATVVTSPKHDSLEGGCMALSAGPRCDSFLVRAVGMLLPRPVRGAQ